MQKILIMTMVMLCAIPLFAQEEVSQPETLNDQFEAVVNSSNNYQEYKVVQKSKLNNLKQVISDSVSKFKNDISKLNGVISSQQEDLATINSNLAQLTTDLESCREQENGIQFLGILTSKSLYNTIVWTIIIALSALLLFFFYKYKNSHILTREAREKLSEIEVEFELHRQKKLEEIQIIKRKLQDELNKNKKI